MILNDHRPYGQSIGTYSDFPTEQIGQVQPSGRSLKEVPGGMSLMGSPSAGS